MAATHPPTWDAEKKSLIEVLRKFKGLLSSQRCSWISRFSVLNLQCGIFLIHPSHLAGWQGQQHRKLSNKLFCLRVPSQWDMPITPQLGGVLIRHLKHLNQLLFVVEEQWLCSELVLDGRSPDSISEGQPTHTLPSTISFFQSVPTARGWRWWWECRSTALLSHPALSSSQHLH